MSEHQKSNDRVLSMEDVLSVDDREYVNVLVPEWGGSVRLRVLTALEALDFHEQLKNPNVSKKAMIRLVHLCAVNADGTQMFPRPDQVDALGKKNIKALMRLQDAALEINDLLPEAEKDKRKKREAELKNGSGEVEAGDSLSNSPSSSDV